MASKKAAPQKKKKKARAIAGESALEQIKDELNRMQAESIAPPVIPPQQLVVEGIALARDATRHRAMLEKKGLDPELIDSLAVRSEALSEAQSALVNFRKRARSKEDISLELLARELRGDMVADGRHACRGEVDANRTLDEIMEGEGTADLIQDLRSLAAFFRRHVPALKKIGVEPEITAEHAEEVADDLEQSVVGRTDTEAETAAIGVRDRAATYLYAAMREIRETGRYAFRKEPALAALFVSAYVERKDARAAKARAGKKKTGGVG